MNWAWLIFGALIAIIILKVVMKTLKITLFLALIGLLIFAYLFLQHGSLFKG